MLLKAEVNEAFREGTPIRMIVKDTSALPDAVVATVPGTVERGRDGKLRAVAEWEVTGRSRTRQDQLRLEFHAVGRGLRSSVGTLKIRPARLVQVEIGAGGESCGAVTLKAGKRVYVVGTGRAVEQAPVVQGRRVEFEIPLDYRGVLTIEQSGAPLVRVDLSRVPGQDTVKLKLASAGRQTSRPAAVAPGWNRPPYVEPRPAPTISAPGYASAFGGRVSLGGPAQTIDRELFYVCELDDPGPLADLQDGGLYTTDRATDAQLKKLHDTVVGVTTEVLSRGTILALKLRKAKFRIVKKGEQHVLVVLADRATRREFARIDESFRIVSRRNIGAGTEFAEDLTRGASMGASQVARRSFLALGNKASWVGVLIVGGGEAVYNLAQGESFGTVLDSFGMTALKGALGMAIGTAVVGAGVAITAAAWPLLFGAALVVATGPLIVASIIVGFGVGLVLDKVIPRSTLSEWLTDVGNTAEHWLQEFDDGLRSFGQWFGAPARVSLATHGG